MQAGVDSGRTRRWVLDNLPAITFRVDADGRITEVGGPLDEWLRTTRDELVGSVALDMIDPGWEEALAVSAGLDSVTHPGVGGPIDTAVRCGDGTTRRFDLWASHRGDHVVCALSPPSAQAGILDVLVQLETSSFAATADEVCRVLQRTPVFADVAVTVVDDRGRWDVIATADLPVVLVDGTIPDATLAAGVATDEPVLVEDLTEFGGLAELIGASGYRSVWFQPVRGPSVAGKATIVAFRPSVVGISDEWVLYQQAAHVLGAAGSLNQLG